MVSDRSGNGQFSVMRSVASANNIRSVCANGTHHFWTTGIADGVFVGAGSAPSSRLKLVDGTPRFAAIFDRRLHISSDRDLERLGEDGAFTEILTPNATELCSFFFAKLGGGSEVDTLWMTTSGSLAKFSLVNGVWSQVSSFAVPVPRGLHGRVTSSGVELLISAERGTLHLYVDSLVPGAHMMGAPKQLVFTSGARYRGIAFVPTTITASSTIPPTTTSSSTVQTTATDADLLTTTSVSSTSTQIDSSSSTVQITATDTSSSALVVSSSSPPVDNTALIAGVAAGSAAGALLLAGLVAFCVCRAKRSRSEQEEVRVIPVDFELSDVARSDAVYGRVPDNPQYDVVSLPATHVYDAPESTLR